MKTAYPITITKGKDYLVVYIPDFDINTQGKDYQDAIFMARDAIGLMGIDYEDDGKTIPTPTDIKDIEKEKEEDIITLVDIDFNEYRRMNDQRVVKKNCTIPNWLAYKAEKEGINFSRVLQQALKKELNITEH